MAKMTLEWHGEAVLETMRSAQIAAVNQTMAAAVNHAKRNHPWKNRTGVLEGGVNLVEFAHRADTGVRGVWGVSDVRYALILELGGVIRPVTAKALAIPQPDGSVRLVKSVTIPAMPYIRPAADAVYPTLPDRIRKAYAGGGAGGADE